MGTGLRTAYPWPVADPREDVQGRQSQEWGGHGWGNGVWAKQELRERRRTGANLMERQLKKTIRFSRLL